VISGGAALLVLIASPVRSQIVLPPTGLFRGVDSLTFSDGSEQLSQPNEIALRGDTALVWLNGIVHVFDRDPGENHWVDVASLPGGGFRTDGRTIAIARDDSVFLYRKAAGVGEWQVIATLPLSGAVAVSGTTVVVGSTDGAHVFEEDRGDPHVWRDVARLTAPPSDSSDRFASLVELDGDTALVGPFFEEDAAHPGTGITGAYAFLRNQGGPNAWGRVAALPLTDSSALYAGSDVLNVLLSGDNAVIETSRFAWQRPVVARAFDRNRGGPNHWGAVTNLQGIGSRRDLSGNRTISAFFLGLESMILDRNQGGRDAWGLVADYDFRCTYDCFDEYNGARVAISGDTAFMGGGYAVGVSGTSPIIVFVADTDRDGLRDGIDPCPSDPLNNVEGGCKRNSAAYPLLDDDVTLGKVETPSTGQPFVIRATFTNTSAEAIGNPFFEVTELTPDNRLLNADGGPDGAGATLTPDVGDGVLSPGESVTVDFTIDLASRNPFRFSVSLRGERVPLP
jgi:hypothetical protein